MKTMKKLLAAVLATVMLLGVTACGNKNDTPAADGDNTGTTSTTVLKMGHVYSETYPMHLAMLAMADEVYEKTEGRYKIEIHANSSLGNESDLNEGVNIGTVDMAFTATTPLANIVPDLACLDLPYLIQDSAHADAVFFDESSPIRASLINSIDSAGFKTLALVENGFRQLYTNKKVASTADLKGLKIRVMENPLHLELWNALGASPTAMAASEAMTGLQQGTMTLSRCSTLHMPPAALPSCASTMSTPTTSTPAVRCCCPQRCGTVCPRRIRRCSPMQLRPWQPPRTASSVIWTRATARRSSTSW